MCNSLVITVACTATPKFKIEKKWIIPKEYLEVQITLALRNLFIETFIETNIAPRIRLEIINLEANLIQLRLKVSF